MAVLSCATIKWQYFNLGAVYLIIGLSPRSSPMQCSWEKKRIQQIFLEFLYSEVSSIFCSHPFLPLLPPTLLFHSLGVICFKMKWGVDSHPHNVLWSGHKTHQILFGSSCLQGQLFVTIIVATSVLLQLEWSQSPTFPPYNVPMKFEKDPRNIFWVISRYVRMMWLHFFRYHYESFWCHFFSKCRSSSM